MRAAAKILVADDAPTVRYALSALLRDAGYEVIEADSGAAAVRAAAASLPDLVVADLHLPGLPVDRFIAQLKEAYSGIRFIGLSGGGMHQDPESALRIATAAGADRAAQKPVSNDTLLAEVRAALDS